MNDPITTLQAMIDSEANVNLQSEIRGTVGWSVWADCEDEPKEHGSEPTLEAAVEAMAEAVCRWDSDSDFARFHRGEINYFRCANCHKPFFDEEAVEYPDLGEVCLDCDHALPSAILADNLGAEITRTKELLSKAEQALASGNFDAITAAYNELTRAEK